MSRQSRIRFAFSILALGFAPACSSDSDSDPMPDATNCISPDDDGFMATPVARTYDVTCPLDEFPFALSADALAVRDASVSVSQPEVGALCVRGRASDTGPSFGGIVLQFSAASADATQILSTLDLDAHGITQLAFTLDPAPSEGLLVEATSIISLSCAYPGACATPVPGFALMDGPGSSTPLSITSSGRVIAPFADFEQSNAASGTFDTSALDHIAFRTGGRYDFCISDVAFLDASGEPVQP